MNIFSLKNGRAENNERSRFLSPLLTTAVLSAMAVSTPLMAQTGGSAGVSTTAEVSSSRDASFSGSISGVESSMVNGQQVTIVTLMGSDNSRIKANLGQLSKQQRQQLVLDNQLDVKGTLGSDGNLVARQATMAGKSFLNRSQADMSASMQKSQNLTETGLGEFAGFGGSVNEALQNKADDSMAKADDMAEGMAKDAKMATQARAQTQAEANAELGIGSSNSAEGGTVAGSAVGAAVGANRTAKAQIGKTSEAAMAEANAGKKNFTGIVSDVKTKGDKAMVAVTSGTNKTVETEISGMQAQKPGLIQTGDRASVTGDIRADGKVAAERVIVSGGAVVAEKTPAKLKEAGAGAARVVDQRGGAMSGAGSAAADASNKTASATVTSVLNTGVSVGGGLLGGVATASKSGVDEATAQGMAAKDGSANFVEKLTAVPSKQNYSGVIESYEMITVDDEEHVMVTLKSGADRTVMADLGKLSNEKIAQLQTGVRMDVIGKVDGSNIVDTETANLSGKLFVKIDR